MAPPLPTTRRGAVAVGVRFGAGLLAAAFVPRPAARAQSAGGGAGVPARIVGALDALFAGPHPGRHAVHAKGVLCEGTFTPAPGASALSRAVHLQGAPVPVLARFSNFSAALGLSDGDPAANPRGVAIKFLLLDGADTDILARAYDGFPAGTPEGFLAFLRAVPDPAALAAHIAAHPAARAYVEHPKPTPASYATEAYFGVTAFRFTDAAGGSRHGRYRVLPVAGTSHLSAEEAAGRAPDFLAHELAERMRHGPIAFRLMLQLAAEGDPVDDSSVSWPADRPVTELGTVSLHAPVPADDARQADAVFVPTNLTAGISATADPLLLARTRSYRISAERRGAAP